MPAVLKLSRDGEVAWATRLPEVVLRPANVNAFEGTIEQLATAIRLGVFVLGDVLPPERELAERLGVSRSTLREAIAALRESGLVTTCRGRGGGTVVRYAGRTPGSPSNPGLTGSTTMSGLHGADQVELTDTLDFRRIVEPGAAFVTAGKALTADQRAWLAAFRRECAHAPDDASHRLADSRLHLAIATLTGSSLVVEAVTRAQAMLDDLLSAIPVLRRNIENSNAQHEAVVDAILAGDPPAARTAMEEHCDATAALLRGLLG